MAIKSVLDPDMPFASESREKKLVAEPMAEFDAWKKLPSPQTSAALLKKVSPVLDTALMSHGMGNTASPVLRSRAKLIAMQAMKTYDPQRGSLKTHLLSQLRGLQRVSAQQQQIISLPERVAIERRHLIETEDNLRDSLGRDPSDMEIADTTGISPARMAYLRKAKPATAEGTMGEDEEGNAYAPPVSSGQATQDAWAGFVYHDLGPIDQLIMDYAMGRNGSPKLPLQETARRLGLTSSAVSQRAARVQSLLDEQHNFMGG